MMVEVDTNTLQVVARLSIEEAEAAGLGTLSEDMQRGLAGGARNARALSNARRARIEATEVEHRLARDLTGADSDCG